MKRQTQLPNAHRGWAYFLDVDGTLLDIADTPEGVHVDADLLLLIERLYHACGGALALVSGRSISDLDSRLGHARMPRAGQHGLERRDASGRLWLHPTPPDAKRHLLRAIQPVVRRYPGLLLEDKGLTVALHYRRSPELAGYVHRLMRQLVAETGSVLELQRGKRVVEAKPAGVNKGTAVSEYLGEAPFRDRMPVFIGDDLNDEHAFAIVNAAGGLSVRVGNGASCANYRLPDVASVRRWLATVKEIEA